MGEAEQRWLVKALKEAGGELLSQFRYLSDDAARWRLEPDEWCLTEIFGHLRDMEEWHLKRLSRMLYEHNPHLPEPGFDLQAWPRERNYATRPLSTFLREFSTARRETLRQMWSLDDADWARTGEHEFRGSVTVLDLAHELNQHDLQHLWQARAVIRGYEEAQGLPAGSIVE